jgi:hypothetical protein
MGTNFGDRPIARHLSVAPDERLQRVSGPRISLVFHELYGPAEIDGAPTPADAGSEIPAGSAHRPRSPLAGIRDAIAVVRSSATVAEVFAPAGLLAQLAATDPTFGTGLPMSDPSGSLSASELDATAPRRPSDLLRAAVSAARGDLILVLDAGHPSEAKDIGAILAAWSTGVETDVIYTKHGIDGGSRLVRWMVGLDGERLDLSAALFTRTAAEAIIGGSRLQGHTVDVELAYLAEDLGFSVSFVIPTRPSSAGHSHRPIRRPKLFDVVGLRLRGAKLSGTTAQRLVVSGQNTRFQTDHKAA